MTRQTLLPWISLVLVLSACQYNTNMILKKDLISDDELNKLFNEYGEDFDKALSNKYDEEIYRIDTMYIMKGDGLSRVFKGNNDLVTFMKKYKAEENIFFEESFYVNSHYTEEFYSTVSEISNLFLSGKQCELLNVLSCLDSIAANLTLNERMDKRDKFVAVIGDFVSKNKNSRWLIYKVNDISVQKGCKIELLDLKMVIDLHDEVTKSFKKSTELKRNRNLIKILG